MIHHKEIEKLYLK